MVQSVRRELGPRADGKLPSFDTLIDEAFAARGDFPLLDVDADRFLAPASMVDEVRAACREAGGPVPAEPGELVRCIYDSLAADYARAVAELGELTGVARTCINIVGGGSQNRYMNQATANACGVPVFAGPTEGTALGNLMAQMIATGEFASLQEARACVARSFNIQRIDPAC